MNKGVGLIDRERNLGACMSVYSRNMDFARIVCAVLVIISHSFPVAGSVYPDPLDVVTGGQCTLGGLAVAFFMFVSGLMVSGSMERQKKAVPFFKARLLRIYPLFILVMLLTVFALGPAVTELSAGDYFGNADTYRYFSYLIMIPDYYLPGVFAGNPTDIVNASLWYLVLEMICYAGLFAAYKIKLTGKIPVLCIYIVSVALFGAAVYYDITLISHNVAYLRPLVLFIAGMLFYAWRDKIVLSRAVSAACICLVIVSAFTGWFNLALMLFLPYIICAFSYSSCQIPACLSKTGKYSYAMYLVAFPIQQVIVHCIGTCSELVISVLASVISFAVAVALCLFADKIIIKKLLTSHRS